MIEYDGIRFYPTKQGYWLSSNIPNINRPLRLHVYVWQKHNGEVPDGYHIHHIDHNPNNNDIENLCIVTVSEHHKHHMALRDIDQMRENMNLHVRQKATEWHKSEEGRAWHKEHYDDFKDVLHQNVEVTCIVCGEVATRGKCGKTNKFCSNKCKSKYRKLMGYDDIRLACPVCSGDFTTNKYSRAKYCSDECRARARYENNKN